MPDIFLSFFYRLRDRGLNVTPTQWLTLIEGLAMGLHGSSLIGFYSLSRSIMVRDESELDEFDQAFASHFRDAGDCMTEIEDEVWRWLENPAEEYRMDPALKRMIESVDIEALRREFEKRLREQEGRHDGGNKWVGTGGTSPFGHSGYHPGGIRVGGQGRYGSAVQVAEKRRYREHRRDLVLDTRQFGMALKKLRALRRTGAADELDLEETIKRTAREAGDLELVFRPPRENNISMLLLMDVGGSMNPYRRLVEILFSAAHNSNHFKRFRYAYFHNCIYERVYEDASFFKQIPLSELLRLHDRDTRLVFVGDAYMYPGELLQHWGAIRWNERNEQPGIYYLKRMAEHFRRIAWLNPMDPVMWDEPTVRIIRDLFSMYPLTIQGVEGLAKDLAKAS